MGKVPAVRIHGRPTHATVVMRPNVRILQKQKPTMAATAVKTAVHVAWVDTAFKPMERPRIAEPLVKM